jgi:gliding motility-associated-like protein
LFNPKVVAAGSYPIKYTFTSSNFGCSDTLTKNINVLKSPIANFGIQLPACEKNDIFFLDSSLANVGSIVKWNWNFGNNTMSTKTDSLPFAVQYNSANDYIISLKITTDSGCHHTRTKTIAVHALPKVYFGLPPSICLPDGRGTFLDSSTIADNSIPFNYHWNFGDPTDTTSSNLKNPTHRYSNTNADTVKLVVTSFFGCVDSLSRILTNIYPQPKAAFSIKKDTSVCFGDTLYFTDKSIGIKTKWFWNLGFGNTATKQNPTLQYLDSGTTTTSLYIYNEHNCVSDTPTQVIIINPKPILDLPTTVNFLQGGLLIIKPLYYFGHGLKFQWTPNNKIDNIIGDTLLNAQIFPNDDKKYYLTITGNGGCTASDEVNVVVLKLPLIPNAFSPNGDTKNDTWEIKNLESYPGCTVQVFDRYGRLVFGPTIGYAHAWNGTLNGKPLPVGTYYYIIDPKNGREKLSGSITLLR